jgi:ribonuclease HII
LIRPSLRVEKALLREGHRRVAGVDEVGRGALCGPVTVGVVVVGPGIGRVPQGLADSKLLTPAQRDRLAPLVRVWAPHHAVGHAGADEVDAVGIVAALRLAALRALARLSVALPAPDLVLLDGSHDWLSRPARQGDLFEPEADAHGLLEPVPPVVTKVKADLTCASVAAASVLAKTERDAIMTRLAAGFPDYGWDANKGYAAPEHIQALERLGATQWHRQSWRLPGLGEEYPGDHGLSVASPAAREEIA